MNEKITVDNNPNIAVPTNLEWKEEEIKEIKKSVSKNIDFKNSKEKINKAEIENQESVEKTRNL